MTNNSEVSYFKLNDSTIVDSEEIVSGVICDFDKDNVVVGVEVFDDQLSKELLDMPEHERWLWQDPEALALVITGLRQAAKGRGIKSSLLSNDTQQEPFDEKDNKERSTTLKFYDSPFHAIEAPEIANESVLKADLRIMIRDFIESRDWTEAKAERVIRWFKKNSEELVGEALLGEVELSKLQKLFNISESNPMYDCYPIKTKKQIKYIRKVAQCPIDFRSYDYFLGCDAAWHIDTCTNPHPLRVS